MKKGILAYAARTFCIPSCHKLHRVRYSVLRMPACPAVDQIITSFIASKVAANRRKRTPP
jgi:hypothetical protein